MRAEVWAALAAALILAVFGLGVLTVVAGYSAPALAPSIVVQLAGSDSAAARTDAGPAGPALTRTFLPYITLTGIPPVLPTPAAAPSGPETATPPPFTIRSAAGKFSIGQSVQRRDIVGYAFPGPADSAPALVLVSGIHGDETNAWPVLQSIIDDFGDGDLIQPPNLSVYFIESLNPDGAFFEDRLNANEVDLNRNWDTYDWRTGVQLSPLDFLPAGGGPEPFSEPETRAMRGWLFSLQAKHPAGLTVLYFHAAVPPDGLVTPGTHFTNGRELADTPSRQLGQLLAQATGYDYSNQWTGGYKVTGDASTWTVAQGMRSLTVELPVREPLDAAAALRLRQGLLAVIAFLNG